MNFGEAVKSTLEKRVGLIVSGAVLLGVFLIFFVTPLAVVNNSAVSKEEDVFRAVSNIDTVVQKRADTLNQLINTVRDSRQFEQETLVRLTEARSQAQAGQIVESNMTLAAVAEAYPAIKSIDLYQNVMNSVSSIENQLGSARNHYNSLVSDYRKMYRTFPRSFFLSIYGPDQQDFELFEANDNASNYDPSADNLWDQ